MTTIREAILAEDSMLRVVYQDRWLVGEDDDETFTVYSKPSGARFTKRVITTSDEAKAVDALLGYGGEDER